MGELSTQILGGGPGLLPLDDSITEVMAQPLAGWELYRARETIRDRFFAAMTEPYHLHVWAHLEGFSHDSLNEREARKLASIIAGEWGVGVALGRAVADGIRDYVAGVSPESPPKIAAAAAALLRLANKYRDESAEH